MTAPSVKDLRFPGTAQALPYVDTIILTPTAQSIPVPSGADGVVVSADKLSAINFQGSAAAIVATQSGNGSTLFPAGTFRESIGFLTGIASLSAITNAANSGGVLSIEFFRRN